MQQRREMDRRQEPRRETERDAAQPRSDDQDDELEPPETVPSFLTAQELQAPEPSKERHDGEKPVGERRMLKERRRNPG